MIPSGPCVQPIPGLYNLLLLRPCHFEDKSIILRSSDFYCMAKAFLGSREAVEDLYEWSV
jgi:hypothetical protein